MRIFGDIGFEFEGSDGGLMELVNELNNLIREDSRKAIQLLQEIREDITREEGKEEVVRLFRELLELVKNPLLVNVLQKHLGEL
jgi:DNA-binding FadR family transcriptional regulator